MDSAQIETLEAHFGPGYKELVYTEEGVTPHEALRWVAVPYVDFEGQEQMGELIVHQDVAAEVVEIFQSLFEIRFPIAKMNLVSDYGYSDDLSMMDNNSSGFNFRKVAQTDHLSLHAYGLAIDINPLVNPYILASGEVLPVGATAYLDRSQPVRGLIQADSPVVEIFKSHGWFWGGEWEHIKDYHHFEKRL